MSSGFYLKMMEHYRDSVSKTSFARRKIRT